MRLPNAIEIVTPQQRADKLLRIYQFWRDRGLDMVLITKILAVADLHMTTEGHNGV